MPSIIGFIRGRLKDARSAALKRAWIQLGDPGEISRADWPRSLGDPTRFYELCFRYFHTRLPAELRAHRQYFVRQGAWFGEDAFHVLWYLLFRELQPRQFLEIGIYRGQSLSLASLLQRSFQIPGEVAGVSPFSATGDSVSKYSRNFDFLRDTLASFEHFSLPKPNLFRAYSTEPGAIEFMRARKWDCIYIDGNHDYEVALADWKVCSEQVDPGGVIVLDDAGRDTAYRPPIFATAGHPGPSRVAKELDRARFEEILQVGHNRVFQKVR